MKDKILFKVFVTTFIILLLVGIVFVSGNKYCEISGVYETVDYREYISAIIGYNEVGENFQMEGNDPQIIFDFGKYREGAIYGVKIIFKEDVIPNDVTVYFTGEDYVFAEKDSKYFAGSRRKEYSFIIPEEFSVIRLDVNDSFAIEEVQLAYDYSVATHNVEYGYIIVTIVSFILATLLALNTVAGRKINNIIDKVWVGICLKFNNAKSKYKNTGRRLLILKCLVPISIVCIAYIAEKCAVILGVADHFNKSRCIIIIASLLVMYITVLYRKVITEKAHIYFVLVVLVLGITNILVSPPTVGLAHDDEIHYERTSYLSWGCIGKVSYADSKLKDRYRHVISTKDVYSADVRHEWATKINNIAKATDEGIILVDCTTSKFNLQYVPYIPAAAGMVCSRAIGLSFTHQLMLCKLINLMCYAAIFAIAIKCLTKRGKLIAMSIGLIPTSVYMASSVTYDWWVISLCVLGYAMFISKKQKEEIISTKYFTLIVAIIVLALLPKAIYFPVIIPLLLYNKDRYMNSKLCKAIAIGGIVLLIMTFVLPMLQSSNGITDLRGGSDVNSIEQMKYVLTHPFTYAGVLFNFLSQYLSLDAASGYLTMLGYHGTADYYTVVIVVICISAILDNIKDTTECKENNKNHRYYVLYKIMVYASMFVTIVLVATSLYVMFTPVAAPVINGCQYRYLLPVLFPTIFYASEINIEVSDKIKGKWMSVGTCIVSLVFFAGIYSLCGAFY